MSTKNRKIGILPICFESQGEHEPADDCRTEEKWGLSLCRVYHLCKDATELKTRRAQGGHQA